MSATKNETHPNRKWVRPFLSMKLAIIIINWNAAADTICCIRNIVSWKRLQPAIWVVDNGSTDGSADLIAGHCPEACLIRNSVNLGYAGGNNRALVEVLARGDAPILLLNNDAFMAEDDVISLIDTLQANPQIGFVGPLLFDAEQKDRLLTAGGQNLVCHLKSHISKVAAGEPVSIVDYVPGTVMLGQAEVFRTVGLLDENYFFSGETPDLCQRARQHGYLSAVDTRVRAFHTLSRSSKFRETLYPYYIIRNRFLFIRKFYGNLKILFYGFWTLYSLALSLKVQLSGKLHTAQAVRLGLLDGLRGRFGGQNERVLAACSDLNSVQKAGLGRP